MMLSCLLLAITPAAPEPPALRQLCIRAPLIVLARPVDAEKPTSFTVLAVLRGKGPKVGDRLRPAGLIGGAGTSEDIDPETKKAKPRRVENALLFLEPAEVDGMLDPYAVMSAGYRFCTDDGRVLVPGTPPAVAKGVAWSDLLRHVRGDLDAVDRLRAARRLPKASQRVRALTDWVRRRRGEMGDWYELGTAVFDWMLADATPAEAWEVVRLYASLHRGEVPRSKSPLFETPQGRDLLLGVALDEKQLAGDRGRALRLLAPAVANAGEKERAELTKRLPPALADTDTQPEAARVAVALGGKDAATIAALGEAYKAAEPGVGRNELAMALYQLGPKEYATLSGNPSGVCARLTDMSYEGEQVTFFLDLRTATKVHERPTLVVERLGLLGVVAETKKVPLDVLNLESPWADGVGDAMLAVRVRLSKVIALPEAQQPNAKPTLYRFRVEGSVGKDKGRQPWRSEPKFLSVAPHGPRSLPSRTIED